MLKQVRSGMKNIVAVFGAVLLVLSFALWGVPGLSNFAQRPTMQIGKEALSTSVLQSEYGRAMRMKREQNEGKYTPDDARAEGLGDQVAQQVTTRSILEQEAKKLGLIMTDDMVKEYIETNENFQNPTTGKFDPQRLSQVLQANELDQLSFELLIRKQLLRDQLISSLVAGPPAPEAFAKTLLLREGEVRRIGYLTVTEDMAGPAKEPSADDLKKYYEANKKDFTAPEYRTFNAVILKPEDFATTVPTEDELRKAYDANRARLYETPEKRTLYQTTFRDETAANAAVEALKQGKPFEAVAVENGSTIAASTLTEIAKKDMLDPAVGNAAFAEGLAQGAIVGPVKGLFGYAVIQIAGVVAPSVKTFEEVRPELAAQFAEQAGKKGLRDAIDALQEARDTGAVLLDAARKVGVEAKKFGPVDSFSFAPGGAIVADIPGEALTEAFALAEGDESEPEQLSGGGYFLVQVEEVRPPALLPYDQVADEIATKWRAAERKDRIAAAVKKITEAAAGGKKLADAAAALNRAVLETTLTRGRPDPAISPVLSEKAFSAALGAVVVGDLDDGAQTLVEVREIDFGKNPLGPGQEAGFRQMLGSQLNQEYLEAYLNGLREDYPVKIDKERLAQIFNEQPQ